MAQAPKSSPVTLEAVMLAYHAGDLTGARRRAEAVLKRHPTSIDARFVLARMWLESGELLRGRRELDLLLKQKPDHAMAQMVMGQVLARQGEQKRARPHLERALALDAQIPEAWLQLAIIDEQLDGVPAAVDRLRLARAALPAHLGILSNLGAVLGKTEQKEAAREAFEQALAIDEKSALTHFNLGRLLREGGDTDAAMRHYRRAIELKPDFADAYQALANLLLYLECTEEAMETYRTATRLSLSPNARGGGRAQLLFRRTTPAKLRHDIEQIRYLQQQGLLADKADQLAADYESTLATLPAPLAGESSVELPAASLARLAPHYNRLLHWDAGATLAGPAVNPDLDWRAIEQGYHRHEPGIAWFDGLLTPEAMTALRRFCLTSTIWTEFRYPNGYLGSFMESGFCCPLLLQIAHELAAAMPGIFAGHPVTQLWAFKYDHQLSGIPIHADFAAVNVNFWITPDSANLDPEGGGLKVWDKEAPLEWNFATYNKNEPGIRQFLAESGAQAVNVPHRQNRAVMFNSDLFHETGNLNFREGYENRRINVTMLFGRRGSGANQGG